MTFNPKPAAFRLGTVALVGAALTATTLPAQRPAPASILPANPIATLHIDGPAALRGAFLPTNLGKMFAGPEFKDMTAPFMQMWEAAKQEETPFDMEKLEAAVLNYRGRLGVGVHLLDDQIDFTAPEPPDFAVTITLSPDGKTDLPGFCKELLTAIQDEGKELVELKSGEHTLQYGEEDDISIAPPFMFKDHAVMIFATNMEIAADRLFAEDTERHQPDPGLATASIGASINAKLLVHILGEAGQANANDWGRIGKHLFNHSGLKSLQTVNVTYRAQGPAVLSQMTVNFNQNDRGILGMFMPAQEKRTHLAGLLPRTAVSASAIPFDFKKLFSFAKKVFDDVGEDAPMSLDDLMAQFKEMYGLRLQEDIINTFGAGLLAVSMESDDDPAAGNPFAALDGMTVGFAMADGAKFRKSLDTILRKEGLHAGRRKVEYKGYEIFNVNIMGLVDTHYVATDELFMLGTGRAGGDAVRATLDELKARAEGSEPGALPKGVADRIKMARPGWTGLGWSDLGMTLESTLAQVNMLPTGVPPQVEPLLDVLRKLPTLLTNYKVETQVTVIRTKGMSWVYENIW